MTEFFPNRLRLTEGFSLWFVTLHQSQPYGRPLFVPEVRLGNDPVHYLYLGPKRHELAVQAMPMHRAIVVILCHLCILCHLYS